MRLRMCDLCIFYFQPSQIVAWKYFDVSHVLSRLVIANGQRE